MLRKILFTALFIMGSFQLFSQTTTPSLFVIKVPRLYVAVTRTIVKMDTVNSCSGKCFYVSTLGYRTVANSLHGSDYDMSYNSFIGIRYLNVGDSITFKDTLDIIDYNQTVTNIEVTYKEDIPTALSKTNIIPYSNTMVFNVQYDNTPYMMEEQIVGSRKYRTTVVGIVNTDISRTLPSHDTIRIMASPRAQVKTSYNLLESDSVKYKWYYSTTNGTNWNYIPSSDTVALTISGLRLFDNNYMNYINKTILFKAEVYHASTMLANSNIEPFTHRLSAPRILSMNPVHVNCWGDTTGSAKITFDRALIAGERLNLLLKDTINLIDYNMLNISALAPDNSFTWPVELLGGTVYQLGLIGKLLYNSIDGNTYTSSPQHYGNFLISQPKRLRMYAAKLSDVVCKGGNSGLAVYAGVGGTREYRVGHRPSSDTAYTWTTFNNPLIFDGDSCVYNKGGFKAGTYYYKFRDANNCIIKENGLEKITSIQFEEPLQALRTDILDMQPITHVNNTDGSIQVRLAGGTPINAPAAPYNFEWRDSATGNLITNYSLINANGIFETSINNLSPATYTFNAWDANYGSAYPYNADGCKVSINTRMVLPQPLLVQVQLKKQVSCVGSNNAEILAKGTGGIRIDLVRYQFKWYRQNAAAGWDMLASTDSILYNVPLGSYKAEIRDKYNYMASSAVFYVSDPVPLTAATSIVPSSCYSNADGSATAMVTGGTAPYTYEWSNGSKTPTATNLAGGSYLVYIRDTMGCEITKLVAVTSPIGLVLNKSISPVICNAQCNASIGLGISGGTAPYTYLWSNGSTAPSIASLCSGQYSVTIRDNNNCVLADTTDIVAPPAFSVSAGPDREICLNHKIRLDATVVGQNLLYQWKNGFNGTISTVPFVLINKAGTYTITGTSSTGCIKSDTCYITPVDSYIQTDFVVSAQSYTNTNTLLVNLSDPRPVQTQWIVPSLPTVQTLTASTDYCELKFTDTGAYNITMKVWYASGCIDELTKKVIVTTKESFVGLGNQANASLQHFSVFPNPTSGNFMVHLQFDDITQARLRLINTLSNVTVSDKKLTGNATYNEPYNLSGTITAGVYIMLIETTKGSYVYKLIIQ